MRVKHEISSFDSIGENILEDHSSSEEETKLEGGDDCYNASNESFSGSDMDLKTMENLNQNSWAQQLISRDGREFNLETKLETKRGEK